jgi:cell division protein FtsI/penicillin-binding protein 2
MSAYLADNELNSASDTANPPAEAVAVAPSLQERRRWRFMLLIGVLAAAAALIALRLMTYQVVQWGLSVPISKGHEGNPARGTIVDRDGLLLASDRFFYSVAINAQALRNVEQRVAVAQQLEDLIGLPANRTLAQLNTWPDTYYLEVAKEITLAQGQRILDEQERLSEESDLYPLRTVFLTAVPKRYYPQRELGAHMVGFVNAERAPFYGVEGYYDRFLVGDSGIGFTEKPNATVADLPLAVQRFVPSLAGKDLVLTIDSSMQWIAEEELRKGLEQYKAERGTIIVMDPHTGRILAMASEPSYDPNQYGQTETKRFLDPAISEQYEPGSVFKVVTMGAGLDTGVITPTMKFNDTGMISVGGRVFFNSQRIGYGEVTAQTALAQSLNVVTAQVAILVGKSAFYDYVRRFGFGSATQVDLAGEIPGALKTPGTLDWSESDIATNSFGQGLAVTPLQMVNAVASIANGGKLMRPYIVEARIHNSEVLLTEPTVVHTTLTPESARQLTDMMVFTVQEGNKLAIVPDYEVAGKSGTAQIPGPDGYLKDEVNASFVGFVPARDPQLAIIVRYEKPDPEITDWANENAAPTFARVATRILDSMNLAPDNIREAVAGTQ